MHAKKELELRSCILKILITLSILSDGSSNKFTQVGLTSFSMGKCSADFPAVFTRITFYLDWIKAATTAID